MKPADPGGVLSRSARPRSAPFAAGRWARISSIAPIAGKGSLEVFHPPGPGSFIPCLRVEKQMSRDLQGDRSDLAAFEQSHAIKFILTNKDATTDLSLRGAGRRSNPTKRRDFRALRPVSRSERTVQDFGLAMTCQDIYRFVFILIIILCSRY